MALRALDERLGAGMGVFFEQILFKTAGVDADADGYIVSAAGVGHGPDVFVRTDVAGIDADLVDAALGGLKGEAVVKMDIGDERYGDLLLDGGDGPCRLHIRQRYSHDVRAGGLHGLDLRNGRLDIPGPGIAHGLDGDRGAAADPDSADLYFLYCVSLIHYLVTILIISLNIMIAISPSSSTMPAAWI